MDAELEDALRRAESELDELDPLDDAGRAALEAAQADVLSAEVALARHRQEEYAVVVDLGVRWAPGANAPFVVSGEHHAVVVFRTADATADSDRFALVEFDQVRELRFGGPAEDAVDRHPLSGRGLTWFAAHEVHDSRWSADRVELGADEAGGWEGVRHFFVTFHDRSVEVLARRVSARPFVGRAAEARQEAFRVVSSGEDEPIWLT